MSIASPSNETTTRYRPALQVADHIRDHCHIYLDEQLYTSALTLLSDLVISGAAHPNRHNRAVFAPLPLHTELISCLLVHPRYTSQAPPDERADLASRSITYLWNLLAILGPVNARLDEAFSLTSEVRRTSRRGRLAAESQDGTSGSETDDSTEQMKGIIANKGRLRTSAKDFWHIVGWAFNCSVKYPKRWKYWKVWLAYMIDVLDADWQERDTLDREDPVYHARLQDDPDVDCEFKLLRESLLVQYLAGVQNRSNTLKRILRAVFADGGSESLKEFPEVFTNETREVRHTGQKRKRGEKFGDYGDEDDAEYDSSDLNEHGDRIESPGGSASEQDPWLGGTESLVLRQRLTTLLSRVAHFLPGDFRPVFDLYEVIFVSVKSLPLPAFSFFLSPSAYSGLTTEVYISVCQLLLLRLLPVSAPAPTKVVNKAEDEVSQIVLEKCFLPFAASTSSVQDNTKLSILIENMLRLFLKGCECEHTSSFTAALEKGIAARENKVKGDKRRKESDMMWLRASGERLRMLLAVVKKNRKR